MNAEPLLELHTKLGEGPLWDDRAQTLYWLDILGQRLHATRADTLKTETTPLPELPGSLYLGEDGALYGALQSGIYRLGHKGCSPLWPAPETEKPRNRFNDGKCDALGRLWVGTMSMDGERDNAFLYCRDGGRWRRRFGPVSISNGLDWDPLNRYLYYIDTPSGRLLRFEYDLGAGRLGGPEPFLDYTGEPGDFDGMTVDADGCLWIAHWGGAQVSRWDPISRKKIESIPLPVAYVTCCAFGGSGLDTLYITTASGKDSGIKKEFPLSGALFGCRTDCRGKPANRLCF